MKLVYPNKKYYQSYQNAYNDYIAHNVTTYYFDDITTENIEKKYYNYRKAINLPQGYVPQTTYWLIDGGEFVGEIGIRHYLNEKLLKYGGHIGYGVAYKYQNKGFGTKMLALALKKAKQLKLEKVLITCDDTNPASARVIEKNGGVLENKVTNIIDDKPVVTRRYWIDLV